MGLEAKKREIVQLLREYRPFKTAYGGSMPTDESYLRSADYHSAAFIEEGAYYDRKDVKWLKESYKFLDAALTLLWSVDFEARMSLSSPYTGSEADPSIVQKYRRTKELWTSREFLKRHDKAIELLAELLVNRDLYVVWPKRMTSQEEKQIERRNDELYALYRRLREDDDKLSKTKAVENAAQMCGYGKTRAWEIVGLRESA